MRRDASTLRIVPATEDENAVSRNEEPGRWLICFTGARVPGGCIAAGGLQGRSMCVFKQLLAIATRNAMRRDILTSHIVGATEDETAVSRHEEPGRWLTFVSGARVPGGCIAAGGQQRRSMCFFKQLLAIGTRNAMRRDVLTLHTVGATKDETAVSRHKEPGAKTCVSAAPVSQVAALPQEVCKGAPRVC